MEARKRHTLLWKSIRPLVRTIPKLLFNYSADTCRIEGPLLIMANHNADLDPLLIGYSFPRVVYFVASEHVLRGKAGGFLRYVTDIIPRQKGGNASSTVRSIIRHLGDGHDVCIFPEGNRSWDGKTRPITPATGKMARMSGATLVTYRLVGTYFSSPRWAGASLRRGRVHGTVVGVYPPEKLKAMSAEKVQEIIERDLFEDAYARQRLRPVPFKGRKRAEHLETALFVCSNCGKEETMRSEGNEFYCSECGMRLTFGDDGMFSGENCRFDNIADWYDSQLEYIENKCRNAGSELIFSDTGLKLYSVISASKEELLAVGTMKLYRDRLVLPNGTEIGTDKLSGMAVIGPQNLYFSSEGKNYLIKSDVVRCTLKYLLACSVFDKRLKYGI